ncbi:relaxase domain-containing protein [Phytomonospora sp. NPDC050363]|uniref:relaxase domain-containing protein n=1 Tax=Phytomonospora sp. NPDC050363 TaxID=3155642 RepID=UPI0033DC3149
MIGDRDELPEERLARLARERKEAAAAAPVEILIKAHWTVSALWDAMRVRQPELAPRVVAAHDEAVDAAVRYLDTEAGYGVVGARYLEAVDGLQAVLTRHDRVGDVVHLHAHLLVEQTVTVDDRGRRVRAPLDPGALQRTHQAAGSLYELVAFEALYRGLRVRAGRDERRDRRVTQVPDRLRDRYRPGACRIAPASRLLVATTG